MAKTNKTTDKNETPDPREHGAWEELPINALVGADGVERLAQEYRTGDGQTYFKVWVPSLDISKHGARIDLVQQAVDHEVAVALSKLDPQDAPDAAPRPGPNVGNIVEKPTVTADAPITDSDPVVAQEPDEPKTPAKRSAASRTKKGA